MTKKTKVEEQTVSACVVCGTPCEGETCSDPCKVNANTVTFWANQPTKRQEAPAEEPPVAEPEPPQAA